MSINNFRIALIQMLVSKTKTDNIKRAANYIRDAKKNGASLVVLPECFNSPYGTRYFAEYAETIPDGDTSKELSFLAKETGLYIVGGSIPENVSGKYYNTSTVWNPCGELICRHRKIHLFDIDVPGKIIFKESDVLSSGNHLTTFQTDFCKIGLGICYDLRFNEMANLYRKQGVDLLVYPGAFNMTTGPLHWELLLRARAVDNQVFVAAVCSAQDKTAEYTAWGHSMLVNPWGTILAQAEFEEKILYSDIDLNVCKEIREQIPTSKQRRTDLYDTVSNQNIV